METEIINKLLNKIVDYTFNQGIIIPTKPYNYGNEMSGSSAGSVDYTETIKQLENNNIRIQLNTNETNRTSGTSGWSNIQNQSIEIYFNNEEKVKAKKCLGGEKYISGNDRSEIIKPTGWEIIKTDSIDNIKSYFANIKKS
jgi:hypothetical protein